MKEEEDKKEQNKLHNFLTKLKNLGRNDKKTKEEAKKHEEKNRMKEEAMKQEADKKMKEEAMKHELENKMKKDAKKQEEENKMEEENSSAYAAAETVGLGVGLRPFPLSVMAIRPKYMTP